MVTGTELYAEENDPIERKKLKIPERAMTARLTARVRKGRGSQTGGGFCLCQELGGSSIVAGRKPRWKAPCNIGGGNVGNSPLLTSGFCECHVWSSAEGG